MKQIGMSLVEVLVASTILFIVLATVSDSYRTALSASRKATATAELLTPLPVIVATVKEQLFADFADRVVGEGVILGTTYRFSAKSLAFEPPPAGYDFATDQERTYAPRYRMYEVALTLTGKSTIRTFTYREVAWAAEVR